MIELDFGPTPNILKGVFRCIQRNSMRNIIHYMV